MSRIRRTPRRRRPSARRAAGVSIVEAVLAVGIGTGVLIGLFTVAANVATSNDRRATRQPLEDNARASMDEMLSQMRAGYAVTASATLGTTTYATGTNCVVFTAPAFNPSQTGLFLADATTDVPNLDTFAFSLDTTTGKLYETVQPYAGSSRTQRTRFVAARSVSAFDYALRVTEVYLSNNKTAATWTHTLNAAWSGSANPVCTITVNGQDVTASCGVTFSAASHSVTAQLPQGNATLVFRYPVDRTNTAAYPYVTEFVPTVTFQATDHRQGAQSVTLSGVVRLRNQRTTATQT